MLNNTIEVDSLTVRRGRHLVLDGLSLAVRGGAITGLLGPSGCGKTTLIRCLAGTQVVASGSVSVLGSPAGSIVNRRRVGYVTQASSVYPDLSVTQNLQYFAALSGSAEADIRRALDEVGLISHATDLTGNLSGGQRRRVSLAAALLTRPALYLLDEPTVGLDPVPRRDLWQLFGELAAEGATLLVSSHVMDEAARCDHVLLMREGELVADDTPDGLRNRGGSDDLEQAFLTIAEEAAA